MRCLIVDDDEKWHDVLKEELQELGFTKFSVAKTETEAIKSILDAEKSDDSLRLITLDRQLAGTEDSTGLSLLELLENYLQKRQGQTFCIVISGTSSESDVRDYFKKYRVYDFIAKHDKNFYRKLRRIVFDLFHADIGLFNHNLCKDKNLVPHLHPENIKKLLLKHNRRLQKLKEQRADYGLATPAEILTEIQDIEIEIKQLQSQLNE